VTRGAAEQDVRRARHGNGLLLDSHVLLWSLAQPERLSRRARELIVSEQSLLHFSVASLWEIAVKLSSGKLDLPKDWLDQMQSRMSDWGVRWLAISRRHCERLRGDSPVLKAVCNGLSKGEAWPNSSRKSPPFDYASRWSFATLCSGRTGLD
jgi:PIN domain nuclease of toxin-antitoxin system